MSGFFGSGRDLTSKGAPQPVTAASGTKVALTGTAARFVQAVNSSTVSKVTYDDSGNRYIVAFDATGSRRDTWDAAAKNSKRAVYPYEVRRH